MGADTSSSIYLRFAGVSFAAIFVIAAIVAFLGIRPSAAPRAVGGTQRVGHRRPAPGRSPDRCSERRDIAGHRPRPRRHRSQPVLSASLHGLRVWGPSGGVVYSAGDQSSLVEAQAPTVNARSRRAANSAGDGIFVTYRTRVPTPSRSSRRLARSTRASSARSGHS